MSIEKKDFFVNRDGIVKNNKVSSKFIANAQADKDCKRYMNGNSQHPAFLAST